MSGLATWLEARLGSYQLNSVRYSLHGSKLNSIGPDQLDSGSAKLSSEFGSAQLESRFGSVVSFSGAGSARSRPRLGKKLDSAKLKDWFG